MGLVLEKMCDSVANVGALEPTGSDRIINNKKKVQTTKLYSNLNNNVTNSAPNVEDLIGFDSVAVTIIIFWDLIVLNINILFRN